MEKDINWRDVEYLRIIGTDNEDQVGIYSSHNERLYGSGWVLYVDIILTRKESHDLQKYLNRCSLMLKALKIINTECSSLNVKEFTRLNRLELNDNPRLEMVHGLSSLIKLEYLDISRTAISTIEVTLQNNRLRHLIAEDVPLTSANFLLSFPNVKRVRLQETKIHTLPSLETLTELQILCLRNSPLKNLDEVIFPSHLRSIDLSQTAITQLPDSISQLRELNVLDISQTSLCELPYWLTQLGLPLSRRKSYGNGHGIFLYKTVADQVDMSIFDQSQEAIHQWFNEQKRIKEEGEVSEPLNELKVVFLGDGGAGKSHTIARLMDDGKQTTDFPNISTPGIVIKDKIYYYDDKDVKVHFWDFGGQEILHSMHRMFLTARTLYVIMLNVRDGTQDDRARYWLYNLRSFANGAPALLVLNQTDMNENASLNESDLRKLYPNLAPQIVRLSTLQDSDAEFEKKFINALRKQIGGMDILAFPFISAWSRLKEKLQNMEKPYIFGDAFHSFCEECGVTGSDTVRRDLLNWFSDLGVSFCYSGSASLEDYVVLRPDWITNAIYIVLFNKAETSNNGQISHEVIYRMLSSKDTEHIRRTVTNATYKPHEVDYVLKVFRKFRLSFLAEDGIEFLPMLCDANAKPISADYENDPDALEFRMHYEYLPNNVIHRLMVDRRRELNLSNVWLTGGQFRNNCTGLSSVVKTEGNLLRIMVRREDSECQPQLYLNELKRDIERINEEMGLTASRTEVVYKRGETVECFSYKTLLNYQKLGQQFIVSEELGELIPLSNILKQSGHSADKAQVDLLAHIVRCCEMLQDDNTTWNKSEDERTTYIRNLLRSKGYIANDQSRGGISTSEEQAGELDLDIRLKPVERLTIFEALNLKGSSESRLKYWNAHLDKLLDNYNSTGCPFLFHVTYLSCKKENFTNHCVAFEEHIRHYSPSKFSVTTERPTNPLANFHISHGGFLRAMECVYDCGGIPMTVYHFFVRIGE